MYTDIHLYAVCDKIIKGDFPMCQGSIYHYDGYCFNKNRITDGRIAIRIEECEQLSAQKRYADIIRN